MTTFRFLKDAEGGVYRLDLDDAGFPIAAFKRMSAKEWIPLPSPAARDLAFSPGEFEFIFETDSLPLKLFE